MQVRLALFTGSEMTFDRISLRRAEMVIDITGKLFI